MTKFDRILKNIDIDYVSFLFSRVKNLKINKLVFRLTKAGQTFFHSLFIFLIISFLHFYEKKIFVGVSCRRKKNILC